tara:strand:+ start:2756 stop:4336 length:1581 start_codon:yes stop_codon:yes gene_type:complete
MTIHSKQQNIPYKLCILAAGKGTRNTIYKHLHKALLPLGNRAAISRILDIVPHSVPIVIAVGYEQEQLKSYVQYVYPSRDIQFVNIENYELPGSGPGRSLFECRQYLQCPFVFLGADTLIDPDEKDLTPNMNWVGVGSCANWTDKTSTYCLYNTAKGFYYSSTYNPDNCFIGIGGVRDYQQFWKNLQAPTLINGEHQVINGLQDLDNIWIFPFTSWQDTGNNDSYRYAIKQYSNIVEPKADEILYIDRGKVLKYFDNINKVSDRHLRASILQPYVPNVDKISPHFYGYDHISGVRLSDLCDNRLWIEFFNLIETMYVSNIPACDLEMFQNDCTQMYYGKTYGRINAHKELNELDAIKTINGYYVQPIHKLLDAIDWPKIVQKAIPVILHGDLQPENVIYDTDNHRFMLIDWRDRFGSDLYIGDMYYDLSKLDHALLVNGEIMRDHKYKINIQNNTAEIEMHVRTNLMDARRLLKQFCHKNKLDFKHVQLLTAITILNISSVHANKKLNRFLFLYGKLLLTKALIKK